MKKSSLKPILTAETKLLGIKINFINPKNCLSLVENWVNSIKQHQITTLNPEQVVLAQKDKEFRDIINQSDLAIPDGIGIVWAVKLLQLYGSLGGSAINLTRFNRLTGTDLMQSLCQLAAQKHWRVFLLGGKEGVAGKAVDQVDQGLTLTKVRPLQAAAYSGASDIRHETDQERNETINRINHFKPHILFVAYGAPYQEKWIAQNLPSLKTVKVAMGVGGAFDYIGGLVSRAPSFIRQIGLEWLWRLLHEPWRWQRQLALLKFVSLIFREKINRFSS